MTTEQNNQDSGKHRSRFAAITAGIALTSAMALTAVFNAPAHVPDEKTNKQQHDLLAPYAGFIMHMSRKAEFGGMHCCGMEDGLGNIPEKHSDFLAVTDAQGRMHADPNGSQYHVKLTKNKSGEDLPNGGIWLDIPDADILDVPQFDKIKAQYPDDPTMKAPPFNILWTDNSYPTAESPDTKPTIYCLWPKPHIQ
jgi:hypothetical protein